MSWLTETLNKIEKSYEGLNTSAMQGAGSMGLQNIERAAEKMNPEEAKEFKQKAKTSTYNYFDQPDELGVALTKGTISKPIVAEIITGNPSNIKSANAITYDDFGNIIPLSKRDNFNISDIRYKKGGSIHIKEKNKGKFTESAKRAGKSVQEHAKDVVKDPKATKLQKKRAQFALNAKKWKHQNGGKLKYLDMFNNNKLK